MSASHAYLEEIRILRGVLLVNGSSITTEHVTGNPDVLRRIYHKPTGGALGYLDVSLEHGAIAEAELQSRDGHGLRNAAEVEHTLLPERGEIVYTVLYMREGIENHVRVTVKGLLAELGLEEVAELLDVSRPDLTGPETTLVIVVFAHVTDNVRLLQEPSHGDEQLRTLQQLWPRKAGLDKQAGEALAHQTGHIVAVEVVVFNCLDYFVVLFAASDVVCHAVAHLLGYIFDDNLVSWLDLLEFRDDVVELNQQLPVLLLRTVLREGPAIFFKYVLETAQYGLLGLQRYRRVVLDRVQATKDEIKQTYGHQELWMELHDDSRETSAGELEELIALLLRLCLLGRVSCMYRLVVRSPFYPLLWLRSASDAAWQGMRAGQYTPLDDSSELLGMAEVVDNLCCLHCGGLCRGFFCVAGEEEDMEHEKGTREARGPAQKRPAGQPITSVQTQKPRIWRGKGDIQGEKREDWVVDGGGGATERREVAGVW